MGAVRTSRENPGLGLADNLAAVRGVDETPVLRASRELPTGDVLEFGRERQPRRWLLRGRLRVRAGGGLVLAVAVLAGGVLLSVQAARGPAASMPARVVVWTADFKIEVLSSRTGQLIRTLVTGVAVTQGIPTLAVSPTGVVYFDDARGTRDFVLSVPLAGGPVTTIAQGQDLALSPDSRLLAYLTNGDRGPGKPWPEEIVVRDLPAGTQRTWVFSSAAPEISNLSWSPDGRYLAFAGLTSINNGPFSVRISQVLDTRSGGMLDDARQIPLGQRIAWAGFLTPQAGLGVMLDQYGFLQTSGGLLLVGVRSGRVIQHLTSLPPHGLATDNTSDGTEHTITADRTGRYLLIAAIGTGTGEIFQWTFGMPHPVRIISGALRAAWAP